MRRTSVGLAIVAAALLLARPVLAWAPDARVQRALSSGQSWAEVLPAADGAGLIHAAIDIAAPPHVVWAVMTDCGMAARLIATVTRCRVVQGDQTLGWDVREQVTRGNLFVPAIRNVVRNDYQPFSLIRFRKVGGDLKAEEGEWRLEPLGGGAGTRVIYVNQVAARIIAPAFLVRAGMKRDTPKVLLNLRRECLAANRRSRS
ncbi:MAG: SRPBCC family protein [Caulobacteraceae bacterium]|nr:SRPBCC family protein [Caulobacteraceae bacterium]